MEGKATYHPFPRIAGFNGVAPTHLEQVTGGFFEVTGQRMLEGRTFADDGLDTKLPVAVVNAAFARKHFGTESPIGRRFRTVDANTSQEGHPER